MTDKKKSIQYISLSLPATAVASNFYPFFQPERPFWQKDLNA